MTQSELVTYEVEPPVATICFNRPEVLNAFNPDLVGQLLACLQLAEDDAQVGAVVLRGNGRAFSAGADLNAKSTAPTPDELAQTLHSHTRPGGVSHRAAHFQWQIWNMSKPVIAAVHGYCLAGACRVVTVCDIAIASEDATFGLPQVRFAQYPLFPPIALFSNMKESKRLSFTGDYFAPEKAKEIGLINEIVPKDELLPRTYELARRIASVPRLGVAMQKRAINRMYEFAGFAMQAELNGELISYANMLQALGGSDGGFRDQVRLEGVHAALETRDEPFAPGPA